MNFYKYLTIIFSIIMMNFSFAELKTFGAPTDTQEEESPVEEAAPEEGSPEENTPEEGSPEEGSPEEGSPEEGTPEEGSPEDDIDEDEMPSMSEDSEINTDQPVKFKEEYIVSVNLGTSMPIGANLSDKYTGGINLQANVATPFEFSGIKVLGHLSMLSLTASGSEYTDYSVTSFGVKLEKAVSVINISLGAGLSMSSGDSMQAPDHAPYDMTTLFLSGGLYYNLPLTGVLTKIADGKFQDLNIALSMGGMEIFGAPADAGTSDLLDFGVSVSYPFLF